MLRMPTKMPRTYLPSQHYDDVSLSSAEERSDYEEEGTAAIHGTRHPFPLKSTLPSRFKDGRSQQRPSLPQPWSSETHGHEQLQRDFARQSGGEDDVTLSTEVGTAVDEYMGADPDRRRATTIYEDDSFIPGVGRGHHRTAGTGATSYSAHRDVLASSHLPMHPSPATATRHERMRESFARVPAPDRISLVQGGAVQVNRAVKERQVPSPLSSTATSDGEDSESGNETCSTSTSSILLQQQGMRQSKAESTGNHQAFTSTQQSQSPVANRYGRPKLDLRSLDEMDRAAKKDKASTRPQLSDSPSPAPSKSGTPRGRTALQSRKEVSPSKRSARRKEVEGSNGSSGYVAGTTGRKPSDGSSNGRKQAGTEGSTTGETLVNDGARDLLAMHGRPSMMKLPSGQAMGEGAASGAAVSMPDMTGMTSALESPVKTVLGVEHRQIAPSVVQARHLQTSETRLQEFNELAYYVKSVEKNLDQTQRKVLAVEDTSRRCVKDVDALRSEWSMWRETRDKVHREVDEREGDDYDGRVHAINEHIAQLTRDLHSYRTTMEQMRTAKEEQVLAQEKRMREKQQRELERRRLAARQQSTGPPTSSPIKQSRVDKEEEATRLEMVALRKQVNKVAREVERLRSIVDGAEGADDRAGTAKSTRFATGVPPERRSVGVGSHSPFVRQKVQSSSLNEGGARSSSSDFEQMQARASSPPPSLHGFGEVNEGEDDEDGDETVRPAAEDEVIELQGDVSLAAQSRAEKTFEAIQEVRAAGRAHDERTCTVCSSKQKSERRRQARKERVHRSSSVSASRGPMADEEAEESLFLTLLEAATKQDLPTVLPKNSKHHAIVQRLLHEHMDEFYHHRLLYCELADELKEFEPGMNRVKRRILAEHVMEAVEGLEFRAKRINVLQAMLNGQAEEPDSGEHKRRPRNSPPIVDGGSLYRRVVSS